MLNATSLRGTDRKTKNLLNARPSLVASLSTSLKSNVQTQRTLAFLVLLPLRALVPVLGARHAAVRTQFQQTVRPGAQAVGRFLMARPT